MTQYLCAKCDVDFYSIEGLSAHVNEKHPEMKHLPMDW